MDFISTLRMFFTDALMRRVPAPFKKMSSIAPQPFIFDLEPILNVNNGML